jgi:hypothetical protein
MSTTTRLLFVLQRNTESIPDVTNLYAHIVPSDSLCTPASFSYIPNVLRTNSYVVELVYETGLEGGVPNGPSDSFVELEKGDEGDGGVAPLHPPNGTSNPFVDSEDGGEGGQRPLRLRLLSLIAAIQACSVTAATNAALQLAHSSPLLFLEHMLMYTLHSSVPHPYYWTIMLWFWIGAKMQGAQWTLLRHSMFHRLVVQWTETLCHTQGAEPMHLVTLHPQHEPFLSITLDSYWSTCTWTPRESFVASFLMFKSTMSLPGHTCAHYPYSCIGNAYRYLAPTANPDMMVASAVQKAFVVWYVRTHVSPSMQTLRQMFVYWRLRYCTRAGPMLWTASANVARIPTHIEPVQIEFAESMVLHHASSLDDNALMFHVCSDPLLLNFMYRWYIQCTRIVEKALHRSAVPTEDGVSKRSPSFRFSVTKSGRARVTANGRLLRGAGGASGTRKNAISELHDKNLLLKYVVEPTSLNMDVPELQYHPFSTDAEDDRIWPLLHVQPSVYEYQLQTTQRAFAEAHPSTSMTALEYIPPPKASNSAYVLAGGGSEGDVNDMSTSEVAVEELWALQSVPYVTFLHFLHAQLPVLLRLQSKPTTNSMKALIQHLAKLKVQEPILFNPLNRFADTEPTRADRLHQCTTTGTRIPHANLYMCLVPITPIFYQNTQSYIRHIMHRLCSQRRGLRPPSPPPGAHLGERSKGDDEVCKFLRLDAPLIKRSSGGRGGRSPLALLVKWSAFKDTFETARFHTVLSDLMKTLGYLRKLLTPISAVDVMDNVMQGLGNYFSPTPDETICIKYDPRLDVFMFAYQERGAICEYSMMPAEWLHRWNLLYLKETFEDDYAETHASQWLAYEDAVRTHYGTTVLRADQLPLHFTFPTYSKELLPVLAWMLLYYYVYSISKGRCFEWACAHMNVRGYMTVRSQPTLSERPHLYQLRGTHSGETNPGAVVPSLFFNETRLPLQPVASTSIDIHVQVPTHSNGSGESTPASSPSNGSPNFNHSRANLLVNLSETQKSTSRKSSASSATASPTSNNTNASVAERQKRAAAIPEERTQPPACEYLIKQQIGQIQRDRHQPPSPDATSEPHPILAAHAIEETVQDLLQIPNLDVDALRTFVLQSLLLAWNHVGMHDTSLYLLTDTLRSIPAHDKMLRCFCMHGWIKSNACIYYMPHALPLDWIQLLLHLQHRVPEYADRIGSMRKPSTITLHFLVYLRDTAVEQGMEPFFTHACRALYADVLAIVHSPRPDGMHVRIGNLLPVYYNERNASTTTPLLTALFQVQILAHLAMHIPALQLAYTEEDRSLYWDLAATDDTVALLRGQLHDLLFRWMYQFPLTCVHGYTSYAFRWDVSLVHTIQSLLRDSNIFDTVKPQKSATADVFNLKLAQFLALLTPESAHSALNMYYSVHALAQTNDVWMITFRKSLMGLYPHPFLCLFTMHHVLFKLSRHWFGTWYPLLAPEVPERAVHALALAHSTCTTQIWEAAHDSHALTTLGLMCATEAALSRLIVRPLPTLVVEPASVLWKEWIPLLASHVLFRQLKIYVHLRSTDSSSTCFMKPATAVMFVPCDAFQREEMLSCDIVLLSRKALLSILVDPAATPTAHIKNDLFRLTNTSIWQEIHWHRVVVGTPCLKAYQSTKDPHKEWILHYLSRTFTVLLDRGMCWSKYITTVAQSVSRNEVVPVHHAFMRDMNLTPSSLLDTLQHVVQFHGNPQVARSLVHVAQPLSAVLPHLLNYWFPSEEYMSEFQTLVPEHMQRIREHNDYLSREDQNMYEQLLPQALAHAKQDFGSTVHTFHAWFMEQWTQPQFHRSLRHMICMGIVELDLDRLHQFVVLSSQVNAQPDYKEPIPRETTPSLVYDPQRGSTTSPNLFGMGSKPRHTTLLHKGFMEWLLQVWKEYTETDGLLPAAFRIVVPHPTKRRKRKLKPTTGRKSRKGLHSAEDVLEDDSALDDEEVEPNSPCEPEDDTLHTFLLPPPPSSSVASSPTNVKSLAHIRVMDTTRSNSSTNPSYLRSIDVHYPNTNIALWFLELWSPSRISSPVQEVKENERIVPADSHPYIQCIRALTHPSSAPILPDTPTPSFDSQVVKKEPIGALGCWWLCFRPGPMVERLLYKHTMTLQFPTAHVPLEQFRSPILHDGSYILQNEPATLCTHIPPSLWGRWIPRMPCGYERVLRGTASPFNPLSDAAFSPSNPLLQSTRWKCIWITQDESKTFLTSYTISYRDANGRMIKYSNLSVHGVQTQFNDILEHTKECLVIANMQVAIQALAVELKHFHQIVLDCNGDKQQFNNTIYQLSPYLSTTHSVSMIGAE